MEGKIYTPSPEVDEIMTRAAKNNMGRDFSLGMLQAQRELIELYSDQMDTETRQRAMKTIVYIVFRLDGQEVVWK